MHLYYCHHSCAGHPTEDGHCTARQLSDNQAALLALGLAQGTGQPEVLTVDGRKRIQLTVLVDLDPMPGTFHTAESATDVLSAMLLSSIPHYNPIVIKEN